MATSLAAQLAQIRTKLSNPLDLKAQRKAHSKSLLFDPHHAANQDFETIYQLCYEGFIELCRIDPRFTVFAKTLFSEQSKREDRTLMTQSQNERLNVLLEDFMCLVGARLMLKPALQAMEWLVRRFRVHEHNLVHLVMTFLPYHTHTIFPTVLAVLPSNPPATLKFLHPYIQTLTNPSRHTVVYAATHNPAFLAAFNDFVLRAEELDFQYPLLQSYWASVVAEATAAMLDAARLGRLEAQKQKQEDVFVRVLPVLNKALSMNHLSDIRVGCYIIITVLASKSVLSEEASTAFMDAVTKNWAGITHAGLICLAVLAQGRGNARLPHGTLKAVVSIDGIEDDLKTLKRHYSVNRLTLGLVLGMISRLRKSHDAALATRFRAVMEADLLDEASIKTATEALVDVLDNAVAEPCANFNLTSTLSDNLALLARSDVIGPYVREVIINSRKAPANLQQDMQGVVSVSTNNIDHQMLDVEQQPTVGPFDAVIGRLPTHLGPEFSSFLSDSKSSLLDDLLRAFILAIRNVSDLSKFCSLPVLRRSQTMTEPLFVSFHIRAWCGPIPAKARCAALESVSDYIKDNELVSDVQVILPYVLCALSDPVHQVRQTAAKLIMVTEAAYKEATRANKEGLKLPILGDNQIYGERSGAVNLSWISLDEVSQFFEHFLVPNLAECLLDAQHIAKCLAHMLGTMGSLSAAKNLQFKTSLSHSVFIFLCGHVTSTPLMRVKLKLLEILNQVKKVSNTTRGKALSSLLSFHTHEGQTQFIEKCSQEEVDPAKLMKELVGTVCSADQDGIKMLRGFIGPGRRSKYPLLNTAVFERLSQIWPSITPDLQSSLAQLMLELALSSEETGPEKDQAEYAAELLRRANLSSLILLKYLGSLPSLADHDKLDGPIFKRRKTNHEHEGPHTSSKGLRDVIRRYSFVLELINMSNPADHPELLGGLFDVLAKLCKFKNISTLEISYLEVLALDNAYEIVKSTEKTPGSQVNSSSVRADVLIDCMSSTGNTQVHQAALVLIASIASANPQLILHSVMPVFTSLGRGLMRNKDEYSAHVINKTMESVIPQLVQALQKKKLDPVTGLSELLLSFVAAYKDIPQQRRQDLFTSLVAKTGPDEFLFAVLVLLIDKYPSRPNVLDFAAGLVAHQEIKTQLVTIEKYLDTVLDTLAPKPSLSVHLLTQEPKRSKEDTIAAMLPLLPNIFKQGHLKAGIAKLLSSGDDDGSVIRARCGNILEHIFGLREKVAWDERLPNLCAQLLDGALELLPIEQFIETIPTFFDRVNEQLRVHVLQSLEKRLKNASTNHKAGCVACLAFLPRVTAIIESTTDVYLIRAAIACTDQIIEKFGKKDIAAVVVALPIIAGPNCLAVADEGVRVSALLCLVTAIEAIGDGFVPTVPQTFPLAMDHLVASLDEADGSRLHDASFAFTTALLLYVPWIMKGGFLDRFLKASHESANAEMGEQCDAVRNECLTLFAKSVEPIECISSLARTWKNAMIEGPRAVQEHLKVLRLCIEHQPKSTIAKHSDVLGDTFLKAFDLRRVQFSPKTNESYDEKEVEGVEISVNETLISMIYKINDAIFRPIFNRFIEWSMSTIPEREKQPNVHRQTAVWTFLHHFFATLKSIVTSYASLIIDEAVEILNHTVLEDPDSRLLWERIISTMQSAFEHDQDDFFQSPTHFSPLCNALLAQLPHTATSAYSSSLLSQLISAITLLGATTDAQAQHKSLCSPLLQYLRDDSAAIRLAAVRTQLSLTEKLGEEWLSQLPEMLPFIAEGMEDDDENVEMEVRRWVKKIEEIMGESISPMLQ